MQRKIAWLLLASLFSLCLVGWLIYSNKKKIENTTFWIDHTYSVIQHVDKLNARVAAWESLSHLPLNAAFYTGLRNDLDEVRVLTRDNATQQVTVARLSSLIDSLEAGKGGLTLLAMRPMIGEMMQREKDLLSHRQKLGQIADARSNWLMIGGSSLAFLIICISLIRLNRDILLRRRTERQLRRSQGGLIDAIREAQNAKSMQELFLANMSHEIRTPMNGIQGMADLLLGTPLTDQQMEFARIIKRSVNNLLVVVNDVLDFSKIKAGKLAIERIDFRLKDVLTNVKSMFAHRIQSRGLALAIETDPAIPESLKGDPYRLNQVLINLVGNAIKFTERGWIRVKVSVLDCSQDQVNLLFTVADSGIGIPKDSLPYIFDNFSQAGLDISRRYGGTGLGLAICHKLLELQGGEITVHSREKEGTTFEFRLTYGYEDKPAAQTKTTPVLADNSRYLEGRHFLVAEDNEVNRLLIDHVLRKGGGEVTLACNGEEAVTRLRTGEQVDLVIMDLQMPVMDGYAATRYIRQELHLPVPIIAMTANALVDEQLRCLEAGMNDYMTKPFEFADLYKRINTLLTPFLQPTL